MKILYPVHIKNKESQKAYFQDLNPNSPENQIKIEAANKWVQQGETSNIQGDSRKLRQGILNEFGYHLPDLRSLAFREALEEAISDFDKTQLEVARELLLKNYHPDHIRTQAYIQASEAHPDWFENRAKGNQLANKA
jgi:hypothetical protein